MRAAPRAASAWRSDATAAVVRARPVPPSSPTLKRARVQPLRRRAQFEAVLASPPMVQTAHFALHGRLWSADDAAWRATFGAPGPWLGVVVPRRWARRAVTRNAIKRQVRAVAALHPPPAGAWVVRLKRAWPTSEFPSATSAPLRRAVRAELLQLLAQRLPQRLTAHRAQESAC